MGDSLARRRLCAAAEILPREGFLVATKKQKKREVWARTFEVVAKGRGGHSEYARYLRRVNRRVDMKKGRAF